MVRKILIAVAAIFVLIQLFPVDRGAPADNGVVAAPAPVLAVLERSCFDCHSNRTAWPWYSYVAPVSWLVSQDVHEGREHLNFTRWNDYAAAVRLQRLGELVEEVAEGGMPLPVYLPMHPDARLSPQDLETLRAWARAAGARVSDAGIEDEDHEEDDDD